MFKITSKRLGEVTVVAQYTQTSDKKELKALIFSQVHGKTETLSLADLGHTVEQAQQLKSGLQSLAKSPACTKLTQLSEKAA